MIIHVNETYLLMDYLIAIIISIIFAIILRLPIAPERPMRSSWRESAIFPTPIIAIGFSAISFSLGFIWIYNGLVLAIVFGLASALFVKYLFDYIFPKPPTNGIKEDAQ